nr:retrovirus-related Pol polyprotein from transposon TNT 1-94 [Tanacetum cinerariifolium]
MTGNISYLSNYEPFDEGYVSFGQGGCKITGKGTINTDDTNVLLRTPRQHNMYTIDLNNVVSHKDLTCLVTKSSVDELNKSQNETPYELFNGRTSAIGFLKPFGCHVMILNTLDNLRKFDAKENEDACNADAPESNGNSNPTATLINPLADHMETLAVETPIPIKKDGIFLSQDKYVGDILKEFGYLDVRSANTPMDKENP